MQITRFVLIRSVIPQAFLIGSQAFITLNIMTVHSMTPQSLVGKTFDIVYASDHSKDTYRFDVKTEDKIKWERIAGSDVGKGDEESYVITQLDPENILVTWIEVDGLGLSNVLNFKAGTCLTHGNNGRSVWKHTGVLSLVVENSAAAPNKSAAAPSSVTPQSLVGKTFDIVYSSEHSKDTYRFDVKTEDKMEWERIAGSDVGKGDEESYVVTQLDPENLLITWIEADGLGLSNVLNFKAGTCLTHGNNGRSVWKHTGVLSWVEEKK